MYLYYACAGRTTCSSTSGSLEKKQSIEEMPVWCKTILLDSKLEASSLSWLAMAESEVTAPKTPSFTEPQQAWIENLVASKLTEASASSSASTTATPIPSTPSSSCLPTPGSVTPSELYTAS